MEMATPATEMSNTKNAARGSSFTAKGNNGVVTGRRLNATEDPCRRHNQEAATPAKAPRQELEKPSAFASLSRPANASARIAPMRYATRHDRNSERTTCSEIIRKQPF